MSLKSGRLDDAFSSFLLYIIDIISLIFYTVSLTKAAQHLKAETSSRAYPTVFGIAPSLLFRRVSRLSYAGSRSGRTWDRGRGLSGSSADILHKNLPIWSLGLSHVMISWYEQMHCIYSRRRITTVVPDLNLPDGLLCKHSLPQLKYQGIHLQRHEILPEGHIMLWNVWSYAIFQFDFTSLIESIENFQSLWYSLKL